MASIQLQGKIFITGNIEAVTGLHIGGNAGELDIGGVDNPVIRNPLSREPYIPGSSLRGKMRSLLDRYLGNPLNKQIGKEVHIYESKSAAEYEKSPVCNVFGITPDKKEEWGNLMPTRLIVRDALLTEETRKRLDKIDTDMPFTEIKMEVAIDRITSAATPRQNERVPAGAIFGPFEMVYSLYTRDTDDKTAGINREIEFFDSVLTCMELLEDDYLGGSGSRGSGKIAFCDLKLTFKARKHYENPQMAPVSLGRGLDVESLRALDYRTPILSAIQEK